VPKLGAKAFEQAASCAFASDNPLDTGSSSRELLCGGGDAADLDVPLGQITRAAQRLKSMDLKKYVTNKVGEPTLRDIIRELEKPGRDPRAEFKYATFKEVLRNNRSQGGNGTRGIVTNANLEHSSTSFIRTV